MRLRYAMLLGCALAGCSDTICSSTDVDCATQHMQITVDGEPLAFSRVEAAQLPPIAMTGGGTSDSFTLHMIPLSAPNWADPVELMQRGTASLPPTGDVTAAPSLSSPSVSLQLDSPDDEQSLDVGFIDPNGEFPTLCIALCDGVQGFCYPHYYLCSKPKRDQLAAGFVKMQFKMTAMVRHPIEFGQATSIEPTPIGPTNIEPTPLHALPPLPHAGIPLKWPFKPPEPPTSATGQVPTPGPNGDPNDPGLYSACSNSAFICSDAPLCTVKFCASGGVGSSCTGAYISSDNQVFPCPCGTQCTAAAMSVINHCCPPKAP